MAESKTDVWILMLMGIVILLMVANIGLFIRMNQLQNQVLAALEPLRAMRMPQGLEIGAKAPDFTLPDTEGRTVSLKGLCREESALRILLHPLFGLQGAVY